MTTDEVRAREKLDAQIDARSKAQIKLQCQFCRYRMYDKPNENTIGCDYVSHKGRLRDRGSEKPGECASFAPLKALTKEEIKARRLRSIRQSEANRK